MHRQRGKHVLNGDRGEVDYTVSAGDLMTDTHNAPSADDRHHEEWTDEDAKSRPAALSVAPLSLLQTLGYSWGNSLNLNSYVMACFGGSFVSLSLFAKTLPLSIFVCLLDFFFFQDRLRCELIAGCWSGICSNLCRFWLGLAAEDVKTDPRSERRRS